MRALVISLILSLVSTIVLEGGFFFLANALRPLKLFTLAYDKKDLLLTVLVNVLTNPVVVLTYWLAALYTNWNLAIVLIPLEIFAILTEAYIYRKCGRSFRHPLIFSIAANAFSFSAGVLIQLLF